MDPWHKKDGFSQKNRAIGEDWPRSAHTMVGVARLHNLADLAQEAIKQNIPGDFIETGVWRGGCCILMSGILAAYGDTTRKVFVADSFEGLPTPKPKRYIWDKDDPLHKYSQLAVSMEEVKANFAKYDLLSSNVEFIKGFFDKTLPTLSSNSFSLLRLDGDMYESTIVALENLYPKLSPGGFIIVDDYGAVEGCRKATDDYRRENNIGATLNVVDWTGVWWQKPA